MNKPKRFLIWGGWVLLLVGILGFLLPLIISSSYFTFNSVENWAHILLGIIALTIGYGIKEFSILKWVTIIFGIIGLIFGIWGFIVAGNPFPNFYNIVNLDNPIDNVAHLIISVWALWSVFRD